MIKVPPHPPSAARLSPVAKLARPALAKQPCPQPPASGVRQRVNCSQQFTNAPAHPPWGEAKGQDTALRNNSSSLIRGEGKQEPASRRVGFSPSPPWGEGRGEGAAISRDSGAVLLLADVGFEAAANLLARHDLELMHVADDAPIPGSFWGEPEAGVIASKVYVRADTPVHSLLHEACHLLVADPARRASIHTDASDSLEEEDAACYLQIALADALPGFGRERALADMDAWGYSFRLGSARAWFERDAEDARAFLESRGLLC